MSLKIPESLKADMPQTKWGKLLSATPVIMTVIATLLAGLASSEMTRAQYDRSLAAQLQAKAGDQWSYFQAKKMRAAMQRNSQELLQATVDVPTLDATKLNVSEAIVAALQRGEIPAIVTPTLNAEVKSALEAIDSQKPEAEITTLLADVKHENLAAALAAAKENAIAFDNATKPLNQAIDQIEKTAGDDKSARRSIVAAHMRYTAARYDAEARLNQVIANLLELQVRKNNASAERHHKRSGKFFFGMLAAQAAVIISTFAMAARQRNLLWTLAAAAGIAAIIFAIYVYLRV